MQPEADADKPKRKYRSPFERERDLVTISDMYCRGARQADIATAIGMSAARVKQEIRHLQDRWVESQLENINTYKTEQLAKIDNLEREYWDAWTRSIGTKQESKTNKKTGVAETGLQCDLTLAEIKRFEEAGDKKFLDGVQWCIEMRCKILGMFAPTKVAPTDPTGEEPYKSVSDEELVALAAKVVQNQSESTA